MPVAPLLLLMSGAQLGDLELRDDLFDDFCLTPFHPVRSRPGCGTSFWRVGGRCRPRPRRVQRLGLNLETYQASIDGRPLDLTYMEYELLKFLAQNPGKVFTREMLLSRVWGYEYYGGARTVDVHVRRLRAKLGEEQANLIQTVRSRRLPLRSEPLGRLRGRSLRRQAATATRAIAGWDRSLPRMRRRVGPRLPTGRDVAALIVA